MSAAKTFDFNAGHARSWPDGQRKTPQNKQPFTKLDALLWAGFSFSLLSNYCNCLLHFHTLALALSPSLPPSHLLAHTWKAGRLAWQTESHKQTADCWAVHGGLQGRAKRRDIGGQGSGGWKSLGGSNLDICIHPKHPISTHRRPNTQCLLNRSLSQILSNLCRKSRSSGSWQTRSFAPSS